MKTWTNPTIEELEVKMTAAWEWTYDSEDPNWVLDGNTIIGGRKGPQS